LSSVVCDQEIQISVSSYSIEEKMRLIVKKKMEDRRFHQEGKYEDMGRIMGSSAKVGITLEIGCKLPQKTNQNL
jgi:hypothetical protein